MHQIGSRHSTLSIPIKNVCEYLYIKIIYKGIFTIATTHSLTASSLKLVTLPENAPGKCMTYCFSFYSVVAKFDAASCLLW